MNELFPKRTTEELVEALRGRADYMCGDKWELTATTNMMREAAAQLAAQEQEIAKLREEGIERARADAAESARDAALAQVAQLREALTAKSRWLSGEASVQRLETGGPCEFADGMCCVLDDIDTILLALAGPPEGQP